MAAAWLGWGTWTVALLTPFPESVNLYEALICTYY
jgi:hypothetical protein